MKYYIIAGEASGDLHGSKLIQEIKKNDPESNFRLWGGDLMSKSGSKVVKNLEELSFMGFYEIIINIFTVFKNLSFCKKDIKLFNPDKIIFIDYPGHNLRIAKWAKKQGFKTYYYISPQVWAWKESRVNILKKYIDELYVILPFEKDFFEKKHNYKVHYFGNPVMNNIDEFIHTNKIKIESKKPIISILPGSRKQEIKKILGDILKVIKKFPNYRFIIAGVSHIDKEFYEKILNGNNTEVIFNKTYKLLNSSSFSIVASGTATLETALFNVPQIVCYKTNFINYFLAKFIVKIKFISLVNIIMGREVVKELIQNDVNPKKIEMELSNLLNNNKIKDDYKELRNIIGENNTAKKIVSHIQKN
tara:strand:+ start:21258 stop:22340 length:1083 start_codon:yes stop_codon:yes gene_type:complete